MNRLLAFGCSYTAGDGLVNPAQEAWPAVLGELLGLQTVNLAVPGSGNLEILWKILQTDFQPGDQCFVMWSHFNRECMLAGSAVDRLDFGSKKRSDRIKIKHWLAVHTEQDHHLRNWLYIHHAELYLKTKGINSVFHIFGGDYEFRKTNPNFINVPNILDIEFENIDYGNDGSCDSTGHPGPRSHRLLAEKIGTSIRLGQP